MELGEEHFLLAWPFQSPPTLDPALDSAELSVVKGTRILPMQVLKDRFGLKAAHQKLGVSVVVARPKRHIGVAEGVLMMAFPFELFKEVPPRGL